VNGRLRAGLTSLVIAIAGIGTGPLLAFQGTDGFVPMTQAPQENVSGVTLVIAAYAVAWIAVAAYVFIVWRRAGRIERELAELQAKIAARGSAVR
jgi:CcmD family protein